eukprot:NODE_462_length_8172_cov_0.295181.p2 type:complete len:307 gc:universal NODE_462_length_8172_cov_0.295181:5112-4192(-)
MHNNFLLPNVKNDKELAIDRIDRTTAKPASDMNNFECRVLKQAIVRQTKIPEQSQVNILNRMVNFPSYVATARNGKVKISSKYQAAIETAREIKYVYDGQSIRKEATRGYYNLPFYSNPSNYQCVHPGATFKGYQNSGKMNYKVEITLKDVQLDKSYLSGYIMIEGITDAYKQLITYFDAELIGNEYSFLTRKWQTNEEIDKMHWVKFPAFKTYKYEQVMNLENFVYDPRQTNNEFLFFRFKEHFLIPDHRVQFIPGASFAGFYYICLQVSTGRIEGYYYHSSSQWFQKIDLRYEAQNTSSSFDYR